MIEPIQVQLAALLPLPVQTKIAPEWSDKRIGSVLPFEALQGVANRKGGLHARSKSLAQGCRRIRLEQFSRNSPTLQITGTGRSVVTVNQFPAVSSSSMLVKKERSSLCTEELHGSSSVCFC